jgi:hypothetical protein
VNWYKLDAVRETLRLDYDAELAPGVIREQQAHLEVWRRTVGEETFIAFLNYESHELLVPEEQLLAAAESLRITPARPFLERVKGRGGLWLGPNPRP